MMNESLPQKKPRRLSCIVLVIAITLAVLVLLYLVYTIAVKTINILSLDGNQNTANTNVATIDDPYKGGSKAKVVIVEFADFECPYCFQEFPIVRQIIETYGDEIKFIFRDFPIPEHANAQKAAEAGECAHEQGKFWQMHDIMYINHDKLDVASLKSYAKQIGLDTDRFDKCLDADKYKQEVDDDFADGISAGVTGTPTFFINGQKVEGAIPLDFFKQAIDYGLQTK